MQTLQAFGTLRILGFPSFTSLNLLVDMPYLGIYTARQVSIKRVKSMVGNMVGLC